MNYANHSLRTDLQEWKGRLYRASPNQFQYHFNFFLQKLRSNEKIMGLLKEVIEKYPILEEFEEVEENVMDGNKYHFQNEAHHASFCFQFLDHFSKKYPLQDPHYNNIFIRGSDQQNIDGIMEDFISPIVYYLHDKLDKSSGILYLLERYKKRTEWFTRKELFTKYSSAKKSYEQILEDDLRLFLFDQGIEYPFSTPSSSSGRADIVGEIETDDPLIVEVKIFDRSKSYRVGRIREGFTQILKYTNDYNKEVGYLVIFNADTVEINFKFSNDERFFPPSFQFNHRTFYFVVVNFGVHDSASNVGETEEIIITEEDLIKTES